MKNIYIYFLLVLLISCGYPDIDNVPEFNDIKLSNEEINEYCKSINSMKKNIDKCINDYKSNN